MNLDDEMWEPDPVEEPAPSPPTASPGAPSMPFEPDPIPNSPQGGMPPQQPQETQWAPYQPASYIPPQDDFAQQPFMASGPPAGRQYFGYRQPPTWQHASIAGLGDVTIGSVFTELFASFAAIGATAGVGYMLAQEGDGLRAAGGAALVTIGALQLPQIPKAGGMTRFLIAAAALAGAYFLLRPMSPVLQSIGSYRANDDMDEWEYEGNDDGDSDEEDDPDEGSGRLEKGAKPSDNPSEPSRSSPWLKEVA